MKDSRGIIAFAHWIGIIQCLWCANVWAFQPAETMFSVAATARRCSGSILLRYVETKSSTLLSSQRQSFHAACRLSASKSPSSGENQIQHTEESSKPRKKTKPAVNGKTYRADRVLSNRGWGSRSECFEILKARRVFQKFGGEGEAFPVLGPSEKISMDADIWIDNKIQVPRPPPLLRVYHKPKWVLSVMNDGKGRKNLSELDFIHNMHPVGRLDYDTSGLLLFSSDGKLTQTLLHPSNEIQKEYVALVAGSVDEEELRQTLAGGVSTSMGAFPADLIATRQIPSEQVQPLIDDIMKNLPPEYDLDKLEEKGYLFFKDAKELSEVRLVVEEGKHRMVRRILANSGFPVIGLKRERLGVIQLDDLKAGSYRELSEKELEWAESLRKQKTKK
jgi:23S rRNA pseudouridine2605 synthase